MPSDANVQFIQVMQAAQDIKPIKVYMPSLECEVPELDSKMPVKKRIPEWACAY